MAKYAPSEAKAWAAKNWRGVCNVIMPSFSEDLSSLNEAPPQPDYSGCVAPLLLITGQDDKLLAEPDGAIANGRRMLRTGKFEVFPRSGHCSHIEHAERFNEMATAFLRE